MAALIAELQSSSTSPELARAFVRRLSERGSLRSLASSAVLMYHGTSSAAAAQIMVEGFKLPGPSGGAAPAMRHGQALGPGIYLTPDRSLARRYGSAVLTCLVCLDSSTAWSGKLSQSGTRVVVRHPADVLPLATLDDDLAAQVWERSLACRRDEPPFLWEEERTTMMIAQSLMPVLQMVPQQHVWKHRAFIDKLRETSLRRVFLLYYRGSDAEAICQQGRFRQSPLVLTSCRSRRADDDTRVLSSLVILPTEQRNWSCHGTEGAIQLCDTDYALPLGLHDDLDVSLWENALRNYRAQETSWVPGRLPLRPWEGDLARRTLSRAVEQKRPQEEPPSVSCAALPSLAALERAVATVSAAGASHILHALDAARGAQLLATVPVAKALEIMRRMDRKYMSMGLKSMDRAAAAACLVVMSGEEVTAMLEELQSGFMSALLQRLTVAECNVILRTLRAPAAARFLERLELARAVVVFEGLPLCVTTSILEILDLNLVANIVLRSPRGHSYLQSLSQETTRGLAVKLPQHLVMTRDALPPQTKSCGGFVKRLLPMHENKSSKRCR